MMDELSKLYLFFSYTDPRFNSYALDYYKEFKESEEFLSYKVRKEKIKVFNKTTNEDERFEKEFETIEQAYVRMSQFYYLSTLSFERYYINPLTIEEKNVSINSIGDILIPFDNNLVSINKINVIKGYTDAYKQKAIENTINSWKKDAVENMKEPLNTIKKSRAEYMLSKKFVIFNNIQYAFFALINIFAICLFFLPGLKEVWSNTMGYNQLSLLTWIMVIIVSSYDFVFCFYSMYFKRIIEPYYYTKRFLILKKQDLDKMVEKAANKLKNYLFNAISKKKTLRNDIKMFADVTEHKVDLNSLEKVNQRLRSSSFKVITLIKNIIFFTVLACVVAFIIYLLVYSRNHGGIL